jgi:hypothetical protein
MAESKLTDEEIRELEESSVRIDEGVQQIKAGVKTVAKELFGRRK